LATIIEQEGIGTVITHQGHPIAFHLIGLELKKRSKVRWISDFRDPWTSIGYHNKIETYGFLPKKHKRLEQLVLNEADKIIVTSETTKQEFQI